MDLVTIGILVLIVALALLGGGRILRLEVRVAGLDQRRAAREPDPGDHAMYASAAERPRRSSSIWAQLLAPVFAGVVLSQLLQLGGCNTTPTQTRLGKAEEDIKQLRDFNRDIDHTFERREEIENHTRDIARASEQRDKRVDHLEQQVNGISIEMMRRGGH